MAVGKHGLDGCLTMQRKQKAGVRNKAENTVGEEGVLQAIRTKG